MTAQHAFVTILRSIGDEPAAPGRRDDRCAELLRSRGEPPQRDA
ncbi:MAG TPA: hypothetical protein VG474_08480 [Solirubrobacteraceae bacterium]|nr:hypothetical protein [Solirubrobacteraceae bacterium]